MDIVWKYDHAAMRWDRKMRRLGYSKACQQFLPPPIEPMQPVLDVGTGTGLFADAWLVTGGSRDLTLVDPSQAMLDVARIRFSAASVAVNSFTSKLEDYQPKRRFHTVLAAHVVEHFEDPVAAMAKIADCLVPNGRLILVVSKPHWCNWLICLR
ncbi:MAG: class I SAM-dependent methyltransferase [Aliishimia sp.]